MSGAHGGDELVRTEDRDGVRVVRLARGKANALETELCTALHRTMKEAEEAPDVRGVVLTSASAKLFCGGFDLSVLAHADGETFGRFVRTFETLFFDLFLFGKPLVAALNGHAVAGGAILAGTADFRFGADVPALIGLPEANLGVHVPRYCLEAMRASVGDRVLTRWALSGEPISFAEAKELGALDRLVPPETLLDEATAFAKRLGAAPSDVYAAIKRDLRGTAVEQARAVLVEARRAFVDSWFSETGQRGLSATLARLGKH